MTLPCPFKVLGLEPAPMLGRSRIFQKLLNHLTKAVPDHISVVGPRHYGKSVILRALAEHFSVPTGPYVAVDYWDLRHGTPRDNVDFLRQLTERMRHVLKSVNPDIDYLDPDSEDRNDMLDLCLGELDDAGQRLLLILDGFDHVLSSPAITRDLWDNMRNFAHHASLVLLTGSRERLRELCRTQDSSTSDFWEIFYDTPVIVGAFDDQEWGSLREPFSSRQIGFDSSACKELVNWTGGVPLLAAALLRNTWDSVSDATSLSKVEIDKQARVFQIHNHDLLQALWDDCSLEVRSDLSRLAADVSGVTEVEIPQSRRNVLLSKGFAGYVGKKIKSTCRLMTDFAGQHSKNLDDIRRLFGDQESFFKNIQGSLALRLEQIDGGDPELRRFVAKAIHDLPDFLDSLTWARRIAEYALDLIWAKELPKDRKYPQEWLEEWKHVGENWPQQSDRLPQSRGAQCNVLRLITGTQKARRLSRHVSKGTYLLLDHIQSIGDYGQHQDGQATQGLAGAFCFAAVELYVSLSFDFTKINHC